MRITVQFWSYFRDLAGIHGGEFEVASGGTVSDLLDAVALHHPNLAPMRPCALVAIGLEYAFPDQVLQPGDEVSLFPPVQGG